MEDIAKKFTHLYNIISSPNFLKKESLGGEIPFFYKCLRSCNGK